MRKPLYTKILPLVLLVISLAWLGGCDLVGDLEENPRSFASPSNFYKTPAQVEGVYASTMANLWGFWRSGYDWSFINAFRHTDHMGGDLNIQSNHGSHLWTMHYANIADLNFAIASIKQGTLQNVSQSTEDVLMGQAKFLRAWNYFQLVRMFGGLPLLTDEHTDDYFNYRLSRSSIQEVYDLIVADFQEAIDKLPETWPSDQSGRPTADVARALLAKTYLTMATYPLNQPQYYQNARDLARQVIQSGRYALVDDVDMVFSFETEAGPEVMWAFESNYQKTTISPQVWSDIKGWGDQAASIWWVEQYPEQPRKHAYLELENDQGETYVELGRRPGIKKYLYDTPEDYEAGRSVINMPIMRYADVLLIFAEAENMLNGPTAEAVDAVNQIIERANGYVDNPDYPLLTTSMSKEEFDRAVINERSLELCFEYDRWFDIVRKRLLPDVVRPEVHQNFQESDYLWPIPNDEMRLNPNMEQNPGYS